MGFGAVKSSSNYRRVYVVCPRAGTYRNTRELMDSNCDRERMSRKCKLCNCPFTLRLSAGNGGWNLMTANGHRNH